MKRYDEVSTHLHWLAGTTQDFFSVFGEEFGKDIINLSLINSCVVDAVKNNGSPYFIMLALDSSEPKHNN